MSFNGILRKNKVLPVAKLEKVYDILLSQSLIPFANASYLFNMSGRKSVAGTRDKKTLEKSKIAHVVNKIAHDYSETEISHTLLSYYLKDPIIADPIKNLTHQQCHLLQLFPLFEAATNLQYMQKNKLFYMDYTWMPTIEDSFKDMQKELYLNRALKPLSSSENNTSTHSVLHNQRADLIDKKLLVSQWEKIDLQNISLQEAMFFGSAEVGLPYVFKKPYVPYTVLSNFGMYEIFTKEYIQGFAEYLIQQTGDNQPNIVSIGNGNLHKKLNQTPVFKEFGFKIMPTIAQSIERDYLDIDTINPPDMLLKHQPEIVILNWMPELQDLTFLMRMCPSVQEYIMIGDPMKCGDVTTSYRSDLLGWETTHLTELEKYQICMFDHPDIQSSKTISVRRVPEEFVLEQQRERDQIGSGGEERI